MSETEVKIETKETTPEIKVTDWTTGISDDMKGYIQNKGWKGVQDLANSYLNLEKLRGVPEDRLLKLPESMDLPEARAVWEKLGTPKDAKDYGFDPKAVGETLALDFLEIGIPKDMAAKIVKKQADRQAEAKAQAEEGFKAAQASADLALKKEWGMAYDQNRAIVDSAARNLGISEDEVRAMGTSLGIDKAMKVLHSLGTKTGEAAFISGHAAATSAVMAPDQAKQRIRDLKADSGFLAKLMGGDIVAKQTWEQTHKMAFPGEISF